MYYLSKEQTFRAGSTKLEVNPLTPFSAVATLKHAATIRNDERVALVLFEGSRAGFDAIAGDIVVRRSSCSSYIHNKSLQFLQGNNSTDSAHHEAFRGLSNEIIIRKIGAIPLGAHLGAAG